MARRSSRTPSRRCATPCACCGRKAKSEPINGREGEARRSARRAEDCAEADAQIQGAASEQGPGAQGQDRPLEPQSLQIELSFPRKRESRATARSLAPGPPLSQG